MIAPLLLITLTKLQTPSRPIADIKDAVVFTINEGTGAAPQAMDLMNGIPADLMIRAWFKWHQAPSVASWTSQPVAAHKLGIRFGGGITCSALYDDENGLTKAQVADMATRDDIGNLVDAWGQAGIRHGSLSSPAYIDYLFQWCQQQIDAGVDCLFMDERDAALSDKEGYDDHSLEDFRFYLQTTYSRTSKLTSRDPKWLTEFGVNLDDPDVCPTRNFSSFRYRAYLRSKGLFPNPSSQGNPFFGAWSAFKTWRDERAWSILTKRIRDYAKSKNKTIWIDANGLAPGVDLQVLGVWDQWLTANGHIDIRENQLPYWRTLVENGTELAGAQAPVVLFHDWGFGNPPFPFLAVPIQDRLTWMRTKGAEIYAAGAFFAFPVYGPGGCDAGRDGSLPLIQHLAKFYQSHRDLYQNRQWLGWQSVQSDRPLLSIASWWQPNTSTLALHVINRTAPNAQLTPQTNVELTLPIADLPIETTTVSPDETSSRAEEATTSLKNGHLTVTLKTLDAYTVVLLHFTTPPKLDAFQDPVRVIPTAAWTRPTRGEFPVSPSGRVAFSADLNAFLQGRYHPELRNPPSFLVDFSHQTNLRIHIRTVASQGAKLSVRIDGVGGSPVSLPDRQGRNDPALKTYDTTYEFPIPPGPHRVVVDNTGPDWAFIDWYEFGR